MLSSEYQEYFISEKNQDIIMANREKINRNVYIHVA